ncbi:MAG: VTT domain-containing protein [Chloroflexota bacterium]
MSDHITYSAPAQNRWWKFSFFKHWRKLLVFLLWVTIIVTYWRASQAIAPTPKEKLILLDTWFHIRGWGPLLFLLIFVLQPLVFFPTFLMTLFSGLLYGPVWGMIVAIAGMNGAASVSYVAGRFMGADVIGLASKNKRLENYIQKLRGNTFQTLLTLHLLYFPFDLVSYIAGAMHLKWRPFALATTLGTLPSGLAYVLVGDAFGSLEELAEGNVNINPTLIAASIMIAVVVFLLTRYMNRK